MTKQYPVLLLRWKLPTCGNRSTVSNINDGRELFTTSYRLESHPSVHGVMSGKQSSLQAGGSGTNTNNLPYRVEDQKQTQSTQVKNPAYRVQDLKQRRTIQSIEWQIRNKYRGEQSSLQGARSEINTEVNDPAYRVADQKQNNPAYRVGDQKQR